MDDQVRKKFVSDVPKEALLQESHQVVLSPTASQIRYILASDQYPLGLRHSRLTFKKCDVVNLVDSQSGVKRRIRKTFKKIDVDSWTDDEIREFWRKKDTTIFTKTDDDLALMIRKWRVKGHPKKSKLKEVKSGQDVLSSPSVPSSPLLSAPSVSPKPSDLLMDEEEKKTKQRRKGKGKVDKKKKKGSDDTEKFVAPVSHGKFGSSRRKAVTVIPPIAPSSSGSLITTSKTVLIEHKPSLLREKSETMLSMTHSTSRSEIFIPVKSGYRRNWAYLGAMVLEKVKYKFNLTDKTKAKVPSAVKMRWQLVTTEAVKQDASISVGVVKTLENIVARTTAARDTALMASMGTKTWLTARWDDQEIVPEHVSINDLLRKHAPRKYGGAVKQVELMHQHSVDVTQMVYRHGSIHRDSAGRRQELLEKQQRQERIAEVERTKKKKAGSKKKGPIGDAKGLPRSSGERGSNEGKVVKEAASDKEQEKDISRRGALHKLDPIQKFLPKRSTTDFLPQTRVVTGSWNLQIPQEDTISTASELEDWLKLQTQATTKAPDMDSRKKSKQNILTELYNAPHLLTYSSSRRELIKDPDSMENLDDSLLERVLDLPQAEFHSALRAMTAPTSVNTIDLTPKLKLKTSVRKGSASKLADGGAPKKPSSTEVPSRKASARDRNDPVQQRGSRERSLSGVQIREEDSSHGTTIGQPPLSHSQDLQALQESMTLIEQEKDFREGKQRIVSGKHKKGLQIKESKLKERGQLPRSRENDQKLASPSTQGTDVTDFQRADDLPTPQTVGSVLQGLGTSPTMQSVVSTSQRGDTLLTNYRGVPSLQKQDSLETQQRDLTTTQISDPLLTKYRGVPSLQKQDSSVTQQRDLTTTQISDPLLTKYRGVPSLQKQDSSVTQQRDVPTTQIRDPTLTQYRGAPSLQKQGSSGTLHRGVSSREKVGPLNKRKSGVLIRRSKDGTGSPKLDMARKQRRDKKKRKDLKLLKAMHEEDVSLYDSLRQRQKDIAPLTQKATSLQKRCGSKSSQRADTALSDLSDFPESTVTGSSDFDAEESSSSQDSDVSDTERRETAGGVKKRKDFKANQRKEAKLKRLKEGRKQHRKHVSQLDPEDPYLTQRYGYEFSQEIDSFKPQREMTFPLSKSSAFTQEEDVVQMYESRDSSSRPQRDDRILPGMGSPPRSVRKTSRSFSAGTAKRDSADHRKEKRVHMKSPVERKYFPGENLAERFAHDPRVRRARRERQLLLQREAEAAKPKFEGWDDEGKEGTYKITKPATVIQNAQELLKMMDKEHEENMLMLETCGQEKPTRPTQQLEGLAYISTFGLEELFEYMLCNLVQYRPESPLDYLINMTRYIIKQMNIRFQTGAALRQQSVHTVTEVDSVESLGTPASFTSETGESESIIFNASQEQDSSQPVSNVSRDL